jgi:DNA-binding IscR family transcriptional regulator
MECRYAEADRLEKVRYGKGGGSSGRVAARKSDDNYAQMQNDVCAIQYALLQSARSQLTTVLANLVLQGLLRTKQQSKSTMYSIKMKESRTPPSESYLESRAW